MFKFFGAMIGWSIRTTSALNLDLPPIFWKKILNVEPDEMDLKMIDTFSWQVIQDLKKYRKKESDIEKSSMLGLGFSASAQASDTFATVGDLSLTGTSSEPIFTR
jgi:hypothetical protein